MGLRKGLFIIPFLLLSFSIAFRVHAETSELLSSGDSLFIKFSTGKSLTFQSEISTIVFTVDSGFLNGSNGSYQLRVREGYLTFYSNNAANLTVTFPDRPNDLYFASSEFATQTGNFTYFALVPSGKGIIFNWGLHDFNFLDAYFWLGTGVGGIVLMIFAPSWVAYKIKKDGLDSSTMERFGYGMLLFLVGFGLVIMWLWG